MKVDLNNDMEEGEGNMLMPILEDDPRCQSFLCIFFSRIQKKKKKIFVLDEKKKSEMEFHLTSFLMHSK
jgi:hypothetical protein